MAVRESGDIFGPDELSFGGQGANIIVNNPELYQVAVCTSKRDLVRFVVCAANEDLASQTTGDWMTERCTNMDLTPPLSYTVFGHIQETKPLTSMDEDYYRGVFNR